MLALVRGLVYATVFIGVLLVFVPQWLLDATAITRPAGLVPWTIVGGVIAALGAAVALWCIATFALVGKGTPAPFDPPRRLVATGPYRIVRNPMYIGAALVLAGTAIVYRSLAVALFAIVFIGVAHAFVRLYEEPTLHRLFGAPYADYCHAVRRWVPQWRS